MVSLLVYVFYDRCKIRIFDNYIVRLNIPHTPSKVGVLESITFSYTPEEAMSVGLVKACVL